MNNITENNWTFCHFKSLQLKAFISFGADPVEDLSAEPALLYFVTLTDHDDAEVFQSDFEKLDLACDFLNEKYGHWEFINAEEDNGGGGCGTCAAK